MNYGRSIRAGEAIARDCLPASHAAHRIRHGCTAAWVSACVPEDEWHHSNTYRRADGQPTNYYDFADSWSLWFAANWHAARQGNRTAARRVRDLRLARRTAGISAADVAEALRGEPPELPAAAPVVGKMLVGIYDLTRRSYTWSRGRFRPENETIRVRDPEYRGAWLTWTGGRCKKNSVIALTAVTAEQLAKEESDRARRAAESAARQNAFEAQYRASRAEHERQRNNLIANYRRQPNANRAATLWQEHGLCPALVAMGVAQEMRP